MNLDLPPGLARLLDALRAAGGKPYVVGGAVRDALLGFPIKDYDVEVFGLPAERLEPVLAAARPGGRGGPGLPRLQALRGRGRRGRARRLPPAPRLEGRPRAPRDRRGGRPRPLRRGRRRAAATSRSTRCCSTRRRASSSTPGAAGGTSRPASCARWTRRRSARTRCGRCAPSSSPRATSSRWTRRPPRCAPPCRSRELPAERVFGEIEKLLLKARRPVARPGAPEGVGDAAASSPRSSCPSRRRRRTRPGIPRATSGSHTLQVVDEAAALRRRTSATTGRGSSR